MKNLAIIVIGTNSSGKTTLVRGINKYFSENIGSEETKVVEWKEIDPEKNIEKKCAYTILSKVSGNIGVLRDNTPTGGADTVSSRFQSRRSIEELIKVKPIVTLDPIMATRPYMYMLRDMVETLYIIFLDIDEENNIERLKFRRSQKLGVDPDEIAITQKTKDNIASKRNNFRNLFNYTKDEANKSLKINTSGMSREKVLKKALKFIEKSITS